MNIVIQYVAINKITIQSGAISGVDNFIIKNNKHKIDLLLQSKETKLSVLSPMQIKFIEIPNFDGSI